MKTAERIVMVLILFALVGGGAWIYFSVLHKEKQVQEAVERGDYEIPKTDARKELADKSTDWHVIFPEVIPITIGSTSVQASVADTMAERIKGLSDTPYMPVGVVKLFVFNAAGEQSIWMKDMNYPLDIIWTEKDGTIVHIEKNVSPDTYPKSFSSPKPAWYVVEANAGFVASSSIKLGDKLSLQGS
jgi:uncharacterized membrane protein (UPF0127 family)